MLQFLDQPENLESEEVRFKKMMKERMENPAPSLDAGMLDPSVPEMAPAPYFPGQDLMRDKYIRQEPGSGVT